MRPIDDKAMNEPHIIRALDQDLETEADFVKLGHPALANCSINGLLRRFMGKHLMLDLKLYDTPYAIEIAVQQFIYQPYFLTVYALDSMLRAAVQAGANVLAVGELTTGEGLWGAYALARQADKFKCRGIVCRADKVPDVKKYYPDILCVCPGIRLPGEPSNGHVKVFTPSEAASFGADYIMVGRSKA